MGVQHENPNLEKEGQGLTEYAALQGQRGSLAPPQGQRGSLAPPVELGLVPFYCGFLHTVTRLVWLSPCDK